MHNNLTHSDGADAVLRDAIEVSQMAWHLEDCNVPLLEGLAFNVIPKLVTLRAHHAESIRAFKKIKDALREAEVLLHKVYVDYGIALIDDGDGNWVSVANAADRMDAAIDATEALLSRATGT